MCPFAKSDPFQTRLFERRNELRKAGIPKHRCLTLARIDLMRERQGKPRIEWNANV